MKSKQIVCSIIIFILFLNIYAKAQDVSDLFKNRVQLSFSFPLQTDSLMQELTQIISIDKVQDERVYAVAHEKQFQQFCSFNIDYQLELTALDIYSHENWIMQDDYTQKNTQSWDTYPTYNAYVQLMQKFVSDFPHLCRLDTIGFSTNNRLLLSLEISNNPGVLEDKPEFFYTSTIHGDETIGFVLMLRLIDTLLNSYGKNERLTYMLDNIKIFINPNANPDGTYYGGNHTVAGSIRYNANMIDLNRNFPDFIGGQYPSGAWQAETKAFMDYADKRKFVMSANFHGGIELVNYPWDGNDTDNHADRLWWQYIGKEYADTAQFYSPSGYFDELISGSTIPGLTCGGKWYVIYGGRQDYMNYYHNCREVTIEISDEKNPPSSELPYFWEWNYRSMLNYMEQVLYGIRGIVTDACTGQAIKAKIELIGHDLDNSHVYSFLPIGNFHRPLKAGTYNMKVSATGYQDVIIEKIKIEDKQTIYKNIEMIPNIPYADFELASIDICNGTVIFKNTSDASISSEFYWDFGDLSSSTEFEPIHQYKNSGVYTVSLLVKNCAGEDLIIKENIVKINVLSPPMVEDVEICNNTSANLSALSNNIVHWWDATGNNLLHVGSAYQTPVLNETSVFLVSAVKDNLFFIGKQDTIGPNKVANEELNNHGLVFDAYANIKLLTLDIYADAETTTIVQLKDENNMLVSSTETLFLSKGKNTVELLFDVPIGSNYKLICVNAKNLIYNNYFGYITAYPFFEDGIMSITSSTSTDEPLALYYFLYNLQVEKSDIFHAGQIEVTTNGGFLANTHGLIFNCEKEVLLESVKIYAKNAGNKTIALIDADNGILSSVNVFVPAGESRVELQFLIPAKNNLKLIAEGSTTLWRDGGQTAPILPYPYDIDNLISIHSNTANDLRYYYYFYDWIISESNYCESPKIPLIVDVFAEPSPKFSYEINDLSVHFTNLSVGGGYYFWDFGDGSASTEINPTHIYENANSYNITLNQSNACGFDTYSETIAFTVTDKFLLKTQISVAPNPANDFVNIESSSYIKEIEIIDFYGKVISAFEVNDTYFQFETCNMPKGVYFMRIRLLDSNHFLRFVKI